MSIIEISPSDAFEVLKSEENSVLIDVRTFEEINFVGFINPSDFGDRMVLLPWQVYPEMQENPDFSHILEASLKELNLLNNKEDLKILFLCRSGARSQAAGIYALNLGYKNCYNITHGFEGDLDGKSHRAQVNGWKASQLPWRQR